MKPNQRLNRRQLLAAASGVTVATIVPRHVLGQGQTPPSETLNVASVGIGGMGSRDAREVGKEATIVAICDVDRRALERNAQHHPKVKHYADFRQMLEAEKNVDAVTVATPDHNHAMVTMAAINSLPYSRP